MQRNNDGSFNVAIGAFALLGGGNSHYEDNNHKIYNKNTAIGAYTLAEALHTSRGNVALGYGALRSRRVYINNIAIGEEVDCDKDNQTVIGNDYTEETIVRGDFIVKGTDSIKRQIVFNQDGTCSWIQVN